MTIAEAKLIKIREQVQEHLSLSVRAEMSSQRRAELESDIRERLVRENAVIVAHYYTAPEIQALAEATGAVSRIPKWRGLGGITPLTP